MRRLGWMLVLAVAGLLGAAIPVALASGWGSGPVFLSTDSSPQTQEAPTVALSPSGQVGALWLDTASSDEPGGAQLDASFDDGSGFSPVTVSDAADPLAFNNFGYPQIAEDAAGDTVAVWTDDGVLTAGYRASGATVFTTSEVDTTIPTGDRDELPQLAMDPAGDAVVVWEQCDGSTCSVEDAVLTAGTSAFGTPALLESGLDNSVVQPAPHVAINAAGATAIVWIDASGPSGTNYVEYAYSADVNDTALSDATVGYTESFGAVLNEPVVAIAGDGNTAIAWDENDDDIAYPPTYVIEADLPESIAQSDGTFTDAGHLGTDTTTNQVLASDGQIEPAIAMKTTATGDDTTAVGLYDATDGEVAAFIRPSADYDTAWASSDSLWESAGPWVQETTSDATAPQLALASSDPGADGPLTMAWASNTTFNVIRSDDSGSFASSDVHTLDLSEGAASECASDTTDCPQIAADPSGDIAALWQQDDGSSQVQVVAQCFQAGSGSGGTTAGSDAAGCDALAQTTTTGTGTTTTTTTTGTTTTGTTATTTTIQTTTTPTPTPTVAKTIVVQTTSGMVLVKLPGSNKLVPLDTLTQIPSGAVIDATGGKVTLSFALPNGTTETATFWGGEFKVTQTASGAVKLGLAGGSFKGCPRPSHKHKTHHHSAHLRAGAHTASASAGTAKAKKPTKKKAKKKPGSKVRSLWSNAKGNFTTSGRNGAATVLGTTWLIRDQCDGTYFYVKSTSNDRKGAILVTVFHPHRHRVRLKRGHHLLAPAPGYS